MAQVQPGAGRPHALDVRGLWDSITSAVGGAFDEDKTTTSKSSKTSIKTIYTTEAPSGYTGKLTTKTTAKTAEKTTTTSPAKKTETATSTKATTTSTKATAKKTTSTSASTSSSSKHTTSITATTAAPTDTVLTLDTGSASLATTSTATPTKSAAAATTTAAASGTSTAAKAGIAIGVLAGIFFVVMAVFILFRRHRKQAARIADDEKNGPFADSAAIRGGKKPSRLSLRPVTELFGSGAGAPVAGAVAGVAASNYPDRRQSRGDGNTIALQNQSPMANRGPGWDRPSTSSSNPFGDGAQRLNPNGANRYPTDANGVSPVSPSNSASSFTAVGAAAGAAIGAAAAVGGLARKASTRKDGPNALDLTLAAPRNNYNDNNNGLGPVPPSPAGTEYSMHSVSTSHPMGPSAGGAAIAAAGGPAVSAVHRVQLDFKPTLEDELDLRAGQLVRLLHEYDDGWALCIRLDRSRQGVVPRTCLSTRPVKPRPPPQGGGRPGPPINPNGGRPMGPQGGPGGRMGPGGPMGPYGGGPPRGGPTGNMGPGQGPRQNMPQGGNGGPPRHMMNMNNNQSRPQSPYAELPGSSSRPASPAINRSVSPAPQLNFDLGRSQSPIELFATTHSATVATAISMDRPQSPSSPPGPARTDQSNKPTRSVNSIGRKPVPGQAL